MRAMREIAPARPILMSVVQYHDRLESGSMRMVEVVEKAHTLGLDGIELRPDRWPGYREEAVQARERARALGLLVTYATFSTLFHDSEDGARRLRHDIDIAGALGACQLRVFQGPAPEGESGPGWDAARKAVEYARARGVVIALENLGKPPGATSAEIRRVLDRIPSPTLMTNIDIGNYAAVQGQDVAEAVRALGDRAASSHLKDTPEPPDEGPVFLGAGGLPMSDILDAFARLPQRILHCFEFGGGTDPDGRITKSLAYLRAREGKI